jgi:hypothetical protein
MSHYEQRILDKITEIQAETGTTKLAPMGAASTPAAPEPPASPAAFKLTEPPPNPARTQQDREWYSKVIEHSRELIRLTEEMKTERDRAVAALTDLERRSSASSVALRAEIADLAQQHAMDTEQIDDLLRAIEAYKQREAATQPTEAPSVLVEAAEEEAPEPQSLTQSLSASSATQSAAPGSTGTTIVANIRTAFLNGIDIFCTGPLGKIPTGFLDGRGIARTGGTTVVGFVIGAKVGYRRFFVDGWQRMTASGWGSVNNHDHLSIMWWSVPRGPAYGPEKNEHLYWVGDSQPALADAVFYPLGTNHIVGIANDGFGPVALVARVKTVARNVLAIDAIVERAAITPDSELRILGACGVPLARRGEGQFGFMFHVLFTYKDAGKITDWLVNGIYELGGLLNKLKSTP